MQSGRYTVEIPHRRVFYPPELPRRWHNMWSAWLASGRRDPSVWQEFESLLTIPGFRFHHWKGGRFAESVAALELHRQGYACYRACALFRRGLGKLPEVYEPVEKQLAEAGLPMPRDFGPRMQPRPRNPDLAAYNPDHGWRFCEVKWKRGEQPTVGQLAALGVLRDLLDATVEVVRVVAEEDRQLSDPPPYDCDYTIT